MAFFDSFSFSQAERHPSSFSSSSAHRSEHARQISPLTTPTSPYEPVPVLRLHSQAISDLADSFSQQRISRATPPPSYYDDAPTPPTASPPARSPSPPRERSLSPPAGVGSYRRLSALAIRSQRQANIRLLSDSSHVRELSALVEQMVDSGMQCRICTSSSSSSSTVGSSASSITSSEPQSPVDEGFADMECEDEADEIISKTMHFRRSGEFAKTAGGAATMTACVRKDVRIRRQRRPRSSVAR